MKRKIDALEHAGTICKAMQKGILLTTKKDDAVNTMTIGWGMVGIEWGKPIFIAYVRYSRYTKEILDGTDEFTVNVPVGELNSNILRVCGTRSGRDMDKIAELGLTLEEPEVIGTPGIRELPLTLECKILYRRPQNVDAIPLDILDCYYPADENGQRDGHIAYYAQIVDAYIIEE